MVIVLTIASVAALIGGSGTSASVRSLLPRMQPAPRDSNRRAIGAAYFWLSAIGAAVSALLAVIGCVATASHVSPAIASGPVVAGAALNAASVNLIGQCADAWYSVGLFSNGVRYAAASAFLGLLGVTSLLVFRPSLWFALVSQSTGLLLPAGYSLFRLVSRGILHVRGSWRGWAAQLITVGFPSLGLVVGLNVILRGDRYVIGLSAGTSAVAVYTLAATISESCRLIPSSVGQLVFRRIALLPRGTGSRVEYRSAVILTILGSAVIGFVSWWLIPLIFGPAFVSARAYLVILLVAECAFAPFNVACRGLLGGGWTKAAGSLGLFGSLATLALYVPAVWAAGALGAALASALAYLGLSVASVALLERKLAPSSNIGEVVSRLATMD